VVIGTIAGIAADGAPLVEFPGNAAGVPLPAMATASYDAGHTGAQVALMFLDGDPTRPLALGLVTGPLQEDQAQQALCAENRVRVTAEQRLELRCGKATILMEEDGRITIRGSHIISHASGAQRIRGGSINLN